MLENALQGAFAAAVVLAAASLALAATGRARPRPLASLAALFTAAAAAAWIVFAFRPEREIALAATGLLATALAQTGAAFLAREMRRARQDDALLERARTHVK
nr:hypothetical protein [Actinomycetota bacterium]